MRFGRCWVCRRVASEREREFVPFVPTMKQNAMLAVDVGWLEVRSGLWLRVYGMNRKRVRFYQGRVDWKFGASGGSKE